MNLPLTWKKKSTETRMCNKKGAKSGCLRQVVSAGRKSVYIILIIIVYNRGRSRWGAVCRRRACRKQFEIGHRPSGSVAFCSQRAGFLLILYKCNGMIRSKWAIKYEHRRPHYTGVTLLPSFNFING